MQQKLIIYHFLILFYYRNKNKNLPLIWKLFPKAFEQFLRVHQEWELYYGCVCTKAIHSRVIWHLISYSSVNYSFQIAAVKYKSFLHCFLLSIIVNIKHHICNHSSLIHSLNKLYIHNSLYHWPNGLVTFVQHWIQDTLKCLMIAISTPGTLKMAHSKGVPKLPWLHVNQKYHLTDIRNENKIVEWKQ